MSVGLSCSGTDDSFALFPDEADEPDEPDDDEEEEAAEAPEDTADDVTMPPAFAQENSVLLSK